MKLIALMLLFFFSSSEAHAAIIKLLKKKKIAVIDDTDVSKGDKVCFYSASDRKRACGKVVRVKEEKSYVKIKSRKRFRRLKKGMAHEVSSGGEGGGSMQDGHSFVFRLLYTPGFMARSSFNYLAYEDKKSDSSSDTHFTPFAAAKIKKGDSTQSKIARMLPWGAGGAEGELFITPTISIAMGGRYTLINVSPKVEYDFLKAQRDEFFNSAYKSHELNFWLDFFPLHVADLGLRLGIGGEFTMSNISVVTNLMKGEKTMQAQILEEGTFSGKSAANIMSARLSARKDFSMGNYGFGLGITAIISPMTLSSKFTLDKASSRLLDEYDGGDKEKVVQDIEDALEHSNNVFSLLLGLSFFIGV